MAVFAFTLAFRYDCGCVRPQALPLPCLGGLQSRRAMRSMAGLAQVTDALIDRMVQAIVDAVDPEQIILFGSRARGEARADSDVDLIVIEAEPFGPNRSRLAEERRLYRTLAGLRVSKDILVYSRDEVEYWRDSLNYVLARALREGRVLYERREVRPSPA